MDQIRICFFTTLQHIINTHPEMARELGNITLDHENHGKSKPESFTETLYMCIVYLIRNTPDYAYSLKEDLPKILEELPVR